MPHTFADVLTAHGILLPAALLGERARAALLSTARTLPAGAVTAFYLECRLAGAADAVDLVVMVDPRTGFIAREAEHSPGWRRIENARTALLDSTDALREVGSSFWLEYDIDPASASGPPPVPGVFIGLQPIVPAPENAERWDAVAEAALHPLLGVRPEEALRARLRDVFLRLPASAHVLYLGVLLSRPEPAVRLCVGRIPPADLPGYLREVGWPGDTEELARLAHDVRHHQGEPGHPGPQLLHFDVGADGVLPRVGFEYVLRRSTQLGGQLHEEAFLDNLVEMGLADAAKRAEIGAWPGLRLESLPHHAERRVVVQRVNHVKVVVQDGRVEAKAYFMAVDLPQSALAEPPPAE